MCDQSIQDAAELLEVTLGFNMLMFEIMSVVVEQNGMPGENNEPQTN